jgi:hypothetical protein
MAVMHFNEGTTDEGIRSQRVGNDANGNFNRPAILSKDQEYSRDVDVATHERIDFRVPTYAAFPSTPSSAADYSRDNQIVPANISITVQDDGKIRTPSEWRINPVRRGVLLARGANEGFSYPKRTIGLNSNTIQLAEAGKNFTAGDRLLITGGQGTDAVLRVSATNQATGAVTAVEFEKDENGVEKIGQGYMPADFGDMSDPNNLNYGSIKVIADANDPTTAGIEFIAFITGGVVYDSIQKDNAPAERSSAPRRASVSNFGGNGNQANPLGADSRTKNGRSEGGYKTAIGIGDDHKLDTSIVPLGNFDVFLYFHNDITHTLSAGQAEADPVVVGQQSWIELTMGAT